MKRFRRFALRRPFLFGIVLILVYALLTALSYPVHYLFPQSDTGQMYADALSKFVAFLVFLLVLWRFGWLKASGITTLGPANAWRIFAVLLAYKVATQLFAFTGGLSLNLNLADGGLALANLVFPLATSLVEETMVRGLILVAMMLVWGHTKRGQVKAVVLSSIYFGMMHLFNLIARPFDVVLFQALVLMMPGVFYAAIVLAGRTLWPAILIHWFNNAAVNIALIGTAGYRETITMWVFAALGMIPLLAYSAYVLWKLPVPHRYELEEPAQPHLAQPGFAES